jgi:hypothetical protein
MFMPMLEPSESSGRKLKNKEDEWSEVNWLPTLAPSRLPTRRTIASEAKEALFGDLLKHQLRFVSDPDDPVRLLLPEPISGLRTSASSAIRGASRYAG